jgi:hypothetical protein
MRRLRPAKRGPQGVSRDYSKVFWFRLCEKGKSARPSTDIIFIVVKEIILLLFFSLESYYWQCLSGSSPF